MVYGAAPTRTSVAHLFKPSENLSVNCLRNEPALELRPFRHSACQRINDLEDKITEVEESTDS